MSECRAKTRSVSEFYPESRVAVAYESEYLHNAARQLASETKLPLIADLNDRSYPFLLVLTGQRLELHEQGPAASGPVYVDFIHGAAAYRRRFGGGRRQAIARALGLKGDLTPAVLDATAGLGRDAFVLACLGCKMCLVERSPIVALLLRDGLERAAQDTEIGAWVRERLQLKVADSRTWMARLTAEQRPDIVYLDPMYPPRSKTSLVKKEMRVLKRLIGLIGADQDASALLAAALKCARRRVVVKRPNYAPCLEGPRPSLQISAKNTRFDVYMLI